jgi:hypothetical protein
MLSELIIGLKYGTTPANLHRAAKTIQVKFREWYRSQNSIYSSKFKKQFEKANNAVNTIIRWWRPICKRLSEDRNRAQVRIPLELRGFFKKQGRPVPPYCQL